MIASGRNGSCRGAREESSSATGNTPAAADSTISSGCWLRVDPLRRVISNIYSSFSRSAFHVRASPTPTRRGLYLFTIVRSAPYFPSPRSSQTGKKQFSRSRGVNEIFGKYDFSRVSRTFQHSPPLPSPPTPRFYFLFAPR